MVSSVTVSRRSMLINVICIVSVVFVQPIKGNNKIADPEKFRAFHLQFVSRRGGFSTCSSCRGGRFSRFSLAVRVEGKNFHLHFGGGGIFFFTASRCKFVLRSGFFIFNLQFVSRGVFSTCSSCRKADFQLAVRVTWDPARHPHTVLAAP